MPGGSGRLRALVQSFWSRPCRGQVSIGKIEKREMDHRVHTVSNFILMLPTLIAPTGIVLKKPYRQCPSMATRRRRWLCCGDSRRNSTMVEVGDVGCPVWRFHAEQCAWRVCHVLDLLHAQAIYYGSLGSSCSQTCTHIIGIRRGVSKWVVRTSLGSSRCWTCCEGVMHRERGHVAGEDIMRGKKTCQGPLSRVTS